MMKCLLSARLYTTHALKRWFLVKISCLGYYLLSVAVGKRGA